MKFKEVKVAYWIVVLLHLVWLAYCIYLLLKTPEEINIEKLKFIAPIYLGPTILFLPLTPLLCQKIKIDKYGVSKTFLFFQWHKMRWDEIVEIGHLYTGKFYVTYKFVYFSKRPLLLHEIQKYAIIKDSKNYIRVEHSDKLMKWIPKCTNALDEKGKLIEYSLLESLIK